MSTATETITHIDAEGYWMVLRRVRGRIFKPTGWKYRYTGPSGTVIAEGWLEELHPVRAFEAAYAAAQQQLQERQQLLTR